MAGTLFALAPITLSTKKTFTTTPMSEQASNGKARPLRPLLPAVQRPLLAPVSTAISKRESSRKVACIACHKSKFKCPGERPACHRCVRRNLECQYIAEVGETTIQALKRSRDELQARLESSERLLDLLRNLPEKESQEVLQKVRSGVNTAALLGDVATSNILLQMRVAPEARLRYELPYRSQFPEDHIPDNPYLHSILYEAASLFPADQSSSFPAPDSSSPLASLSPGDYRSLYQKPFHAAQVVDPLLIDARVSLWTDVCSDDMLMRDLLGVFFKCEYQLAAAFQKDLFLQDMAFKRADFCSSLLVNAVLAYACVCYPGFSNRAEYWNTRTLHYRFLAEAKRLWELEATEERITTVQAGIIFNVIHNLSGLDEIGQVYLVHAIALAHRMHIFDLATGRYSDRIQNGRAFTAWALYSWQALVAISFLNLPILDKPPNHPLPDPLEDGSWYAEIWVKYPMAVDRVPSYFGQVFMARCRFRIIVNEYCLVAYSPGSKVTINSVSQTRSQLRSWHDSLPAILQPKSIVLPHHLQLHIHYYHLLLTIYEPLLGTEPKEDANLLQIVVDATRNLQTLVRLYYLRHGFEAMDLFIVVPLMLIAYKCVDDIDDQTPVAKLEALRSTLMLVTKGLYDQRQNHYLARALFRVISGRMRPSELSILKATIKLDDEELAGRSDMEQAVRSHWPVSVVKSREEMESHVLKNLVKDYAGLNIE